ncbi:MAG TPA: choice-of-anchor tandem repeat GloVer-containing protein [Candidatus Binatia bacterium]|nr:choice-of-anchor tandem repeat GloVer-containing protein [Candidatus Binatia bacterium]
MKYRLRSPRFLAVIICCLFFAPASSAQTFRDIIEFNESNGTAPATPVQGLDGNLYGTTSAGGNTFGVGDGTIYKLTPGGTLTTIYNFCDHSECNDGQEPFAGLVLGPDGNFYGTGQLGGKIPCVPNLYPLGCGTVFKVTPGGAFTVLHKFSFTDGDVPSAPLALGRDGNFYGTTFDGGPTDSSVTCDGSCGTIFRITPGGDFTSLYSFCTRNPSCPDGFQPQPLMLADDGNFYGTTTFGGNLDCNAPNGCGTIFRLTPSGSFTTIYTFNQRPGGDSPNGPLLQGADGKLYGTTIEGGSGCFGGCGTIFSISLGGQFATVYDFDGTEGGIPYSPLIQGTDGNFYGTTAEGGNSTCTFGCGTIFQLTPGGNFTNLHDFANTDGAYPYTGLLQATNGAFYGATKGGGNLDCNSPDGCGTLYAVSTGLHRFVGFVQNYGAAGSEVIILGQDFMGATAVSFNGTPASFTIESGTWLTATVPAGAISGTVTVTTPNGTFASNTNFQVLP